MHWSYIDYWCYCRHWVQNCVHHLLSIDFHSLVTVITGKVSFLHYLLSTPYRREATVVPSGIPTVVPWTYEIHCCYHHHVRRTISVSPCLPLLCKRLLLRRPLRSCTYNTNCHRRSYKPPIATEASPNLTKAYTLPEASASPQCQLLQNSPLAAYPATVAGQSTAIESGCFLFHRRSSCCTINLRANWCRWKSKVVFWSLLGWGCDVAPLTLNRFHYWILFSIPIATVLLFPNSGFLFDFYEYSFNNYI